ncbi:MAG: M13 family metallopeptidase [Bacteroidales bacterium]|nr:M13 family metallopeptidase [Bacteroidales bacterium]
MLIVCFLISACQNNKKDADSEKELVSGIVADNLDTTANPADDFYQFACGGWMKNHPLPAEYSRYGSFDQLAENTEKQLNKLITDIAQQSNDKGSIAQKIGDFYNTGMDTQTINEQGDQPIRPILQKIADVKSNKELTDLLIELHSMGYSPFFGIFGEASPNNSTMNIAWLTQSGLGLGERDYYLKPDARIKEGYLTMVENLLELSEYGEMTNNAGKEKALAAKVWNVESGLAKIFIDKNELRDPVKTNNVMSKEDAAKLMTVVDLNKYIETIVPNKVNEVNVVLSSYFTSLNKFLSTQDINAVKAYLAWCVVNEAAPYLSDKFVDASFEFYGKVLSGKEENRERWKRVINTVSGLLAEPVGQLYVEQYFPAEAKERMLTMIGNLKTSLGERISNVTWMSQETKQKALEKLEAIIVKVGYPDKWRDYSGLTIEKDSYYANVMRAVKFENEYRLSKIGKPVDPSEWLMSPQTVNAYYNPTTNEICFPAAILQPPFFDMNADDAVNYGAIGVVIGHEMTHGFDDQGRQYDKTGNVNDWWTEEDSKNFVNQAQVLVDHFNGIEVLPGVFANGQFTLGENIADNGGLNTSFVALQHAKEQGTVQEMMDGFTANQRFFIAYANVWANNIRDEEILRRTMTDPHSLGKWRVNGTLPHIDAFIEAFDIKPGDKMYLEPEKRAKIW